MYDALRDVARIVLIGCAVRGSLGTKPLPVGFGSMGRDASLLSEPPGVPCLQYPVAVVYSQGTGPMAR